MKNLLISVLFLLVIFPLSYALPQAQVYYSFDNNELSGSNPLDVSGNGRDGTTSSSGVTTGVTGIIGEAFKYDGINGYVNITDSMGINGTEPVTYSFWIQYNQSNGLNPIFFGQAPGTSNGGRFAYSFVNSTRSGIAVGQGFAYFNHLDINDGNWHHIVVTLNGTTVYDIHQWIDAVYLTDNVTTLNPAGVLNILDQAQYISSPSSAGGRWNSTLDEFGAWNISLNNTEVLELYNGGNGFNPYGSAIRTNLTTLVNIQGFLIFINASGEEGNFSYSLNGGSFTTIDNNVNKSVLNLSGYLLGVNNISFRFYNGSTLSELNTTFTFQPLQYFYFTYSNGTYINNFTFNGVDFGVYASINASDLLPFGSKALKFEKNGFNDTIISFSLNLTSQLNLTSIVPPSKIIVNIFDKSDFSRLTGIDFTLELIAPVGDLKNTTTGQYNFSNPLFANTNYELVVTNSIYQTETVSFNFDNQEITTINVYMIEANNSNLGFVNVEVLDSFSQPLSDIRVSALQWNSASSSFVSTSEATTGNNGIGSVNVILEDKVYKFRATRGSNIVDSIGEIISLSENGKTVSLVLSSIATEQTYLFDNVATNLVQTYDNTTNISTVTFSWADNNGNLLNGCIHAFRVVGSNLIKLTNDEDNCFEASSTSYVKAFFINSSYNIVLKGQFKVNDYYFDIGSFTFFGTGSAAQILEDNNLNYFLLTILNIISISAGFYMKNIYVGMAGLMISSMVGLILVPTFLTGGIVAFFLFVGGASIYLGNKI